MNTNTEREELARDIFLADNSKHPAADIEWGALHAARITSGTSYAYNIADGLIAKGYRKEPTK